MSYSDRQRARVSIAELEQQIRRMEGAAWAIAERLAKAEFPHRRRPQFKIGGSAETHQLRVAFERHRKAQLAIRQPLIDKHRRKIERIRRFYGFND